MFNAVSFFTYIFIMAYTPGPNNVMSMSNASENGFKKSFPFNLGIFLGFIFVMNLCLVFSSALFSFIPRIKLFMTILGAAYMLWLAWSMIKPSRQHNEKKHTARGFWAGAVLQFINPKLYIYAITAMSSYILPHFNSPLVLWGFAMLLALVGFTGTVCWAVFGAALNKLFREHSRIVNIVMAALLCYCAVSLFL